MKIKIIGFILMCLASFTGSWMGHKLAESQYRAEMGEFHYQVSKKSSQSELNQDTGVCNED